MKPIQREQYPGLKVHLVAGFEDALPTAPASFPGSTWERRGGGCGKSMLGGDNLLACFFAGYCYCEIIVGFVAFRLELNEGVGNPVEILFGQCLALVVMSRSFG